MTTHNLKTEIGRKMALESGLSITDGWGNVFEIVKGELHANDEAIEWVCISHNDYAWSLLEPRTYTMADLDCRTNNPIEKRYKA